MLPNIEIDGRYQNDDDCDFQDIRRIYIKKTCYEIKNQKVESKVHTDETPTLLWTSFQNFQSGQVYEVVFKDISGNFVSYN